MSNLTPKPDIILLQETYTLTEKSLCWRNWHNYTPNCAPGTTPGSRMTILIRNNINLVASSVIVAGHILFAQVKHNNYVFNIYNFLVPQKDSIALFIFEKCDYHCGQQAEGAPFSSEATLTARLILLWTERISRPSIVPESQWLSKIV